MSADDNVLIVEDEEEWSGIFMRAVDAEGPHRMVKVARDVLGAKQLIDGTEFALAIVDVGLDVNDDRNIDGLHVMGKIRDVGDKTSILVVTGRSGQDALQVARDAIKEYQAYDTIGKSSVVPSKLRDLVRQGLKDYRDAAVPGRTDAREAIRGRMNPVAWDDQVMREIGFHGDVVGFYGFLDGLFGEYLPLSPKNQDRPVKADYESGFLLGEFWSRAIGAAVFICFGPENGFDRARDAALTALGYAGGAEQVKELKGHGVKGNVFTAPERDLSEFGAR